MIKSTLQTPKHMQAARLLRKRIERGEYGAKGQLPPVRVLGGQLGVSQNVVQRAVRVLAKEGLVEPMRGIGVRVVAGERARPAPLVFGLTYPYRITSSFAGTIHAVAEQATDVQNNHGIIKSTGDDPELERKVIEQFVDSGVEGLLIWPCSGNRNAEFFVEISRQVPIVFIDRVFEGLPIPGVTLDWERAGRDIVRHLAQRGYRHVLILQEPLDVSSLRTLGEAMIQTVRTLDAERRFDFAEIDGEGFLELYTGDPVTAVTTCADRLRELLSRRPYEAFFSIHDELIDRVYAGTGLRTEFPMREIMSMTNTRPTPRSVEFYRLNVTEWVGDFEAMIRRATGMLRDMVYLKSRIQRQVRIGFKSVVRTCDRVTGGSTT